MSPYIDKSIFANPILEYFKWLLKKLFYQIKYWGKHLRIGYMSSISSCVFGKYNWVGRNAILNNVSMGDFSYISDSCVILEAKIGRFCSIGPNVKIAPGKHPTSKIVSTHPAIYSNPSYCLKNFSVDDKHNPYRKVEIGNDVWICANVVITDGVTIGDGAVLAANSVITKNVEPYSIVGGVPAKHIKFRFEERERDILLRTKWWEKDIDWIEKNASYLWDIKKYQELVYD